MGASNVVSLIEPQLRIIIITITTTRNIITIMSYYQLYWLGTSYSYLSLLVLPLLQC